MNPSTPMLDALRSWHDFFLLVGGASATLLGLVFVSVALVVNLPKFPDDEERNLFSTPIVAQFTYALGLSALSLAPWREGRPYGAVLAIAGAVAMLQSLGVGFRLLRRHRTKTPANVGVWMTVSIVPLTSAAFCEVSGVLLLHDDLRGLATLAFAIALLDLNALLNAWRLFLWILEQHRKKNG
jgi:hypothetical protein